MEKQYFNAFRCGGRRNFGRARPLQCRDPPRDFNGNYQGWIAVEDGGRRIGLMKIVWGPLTCRLRRRHPALSADGVNVSQVHNRDRVIVMHRWVEGAGRDVVVVVSLNESTLDGYFVEMPHAGHWHEVFNSDVYDHFSIRGWSATLAAFRPRAHRAAHINTPRAFASQPMALSCSRAIHEGHVQKQT